MLDLDGCFFEELTTGSMFLASRTLFSLCLFVLKVPLSKKDKKSAMRNTRIAELLVVSRGTSLYLCYFHTFHSDVHLLKFNMKIIDSNSFAQYSGEIRGIHHVSERKLLILDPYFVTSTKHCNIYETAHDIPLHKHSSVS